MNVRTACELFSFCMVDFDFYFTHEYAYFMNTFKYDVKFKKIVVDLN